MTLKIFVASHLAHLAGTVFSEKDVPGSNVSMHKVLAGQELQAQSYLTAELEQPALQIWLDQLPGSAWRYIILNGIPLICSHNDNSVIQA